MKYWISNWGFSHAKHVFHSAFQIISSGLVLLLCGGGWGRGLREFTSSDAQGLLLLALCPETTPEDVQGIKPWSACARQAPIYCTFTPASFTLFYFGVTLVLH